VTVAQAVVCFQSRQRWLAKGLDATAQGVDKCVVLQAFEPPQTHIELAVDETLAILNKENNPLS